MRKSHSSLLLHPSLRRVFSFAGAVALFSFVMTTSRSARAEPVLAGDVHGAFVVGDQRGPIKGGLGFDGRFGYRLSLIVLALTPEIGAGYQHLAGDDPLAELSVTRVFAGARLGFGAIIQPAIFAHVGYGWLSATNVDRSDHAPMVDGGLAIDLRLIPHISPGVHASYNALTTSPSSLHWVDLGAHVEIEF